MPSALVAGGAGFIGSHLCDALLARGVDVYCLDSMRTGRRDNIAHLGQDPRFAFIDADVTEPLPSRLLKGRRRFDYVLNLACPASPPHYQRDPRHTLLTNVIGTNHLLDLAAHHGARFLLASTSEVYGDPQVHPQRESYWGHVNPTGPRACYDEGKRAAETLTFDHARAGRGEVRVARIFNTYGPRMRADDGRVVSNVVTQALAGDDITIYGSGSQTRSFCYVDDLVAGLLALTFHEGDYFGAINLGGTDEITVRDLVERVVQITGSRSRIVERPLPIDDPQRRQPDTGLARDILGWRPHVDLATGLARTIEHFAEEARRIAREAPGVRPERPNAVRPSLRS